ncbi:MAG: hypothetical protein HDT41_00680 [Lachnospiraceae bacterium]|nr:hypothetical protein [Lachnospiraceae bacterium]
MIERLTYGVKDSLSSACHYVGSHRFLVVAAIEQRQRDGVWFRALFLMAVFLNRLSTTQGKIATDGNFRSIAPWTAL